MLSHSIVIALSLCFSAPVAQDDSQDDEGARRRAREGGRRERRARWDRFRDASPEERRRMRLEPWVEMAARTYELDEAQKILVRSELETIQAERRAAMGAEAEEYDRVREEMGELWSKQREASGDDRSDRRRMWRQMRDNPDFGRLRKRMREIEEKHPVDWQASVDRIEKLLPKEQVKKGRKRWEERRSRWGRGSREWRGRRGERDRRRGERRTDPEGPRGGADGGAEAGNAEQTPEREMRQQKELAEKAAEQARKQAEELHPWEKHVRAFIKQHGLTPAQANAAMSILKDLRARAERIERANAAKIAAAEKIEDSGSRRARFEQLQKPIKGLFEALKKRLNGLLTSSQRAKGKKSPD